MGKTCLWCGENTPAYEDAILCVDCGGPDPESYDELGQSPPGMTTHPDGYNNQAWSAVETELPVWFCEPGLSEKDTPEPGSWLFAADAPDDSVRFWDRGEHDGCVTEECVECGVETEIYYRDTDSARAFCCSNCLANVLVPTV